MSRSTVAPEAGELPEPATSVETLGGRRYVIHDCSRGMGDRYRFPLPPGLVPGKEVLLAFDPNTHIFLVAGGTEFHGRVVNLPAVVRPTRPGGLKTTYFLRLRGLDEATVGAIESFLHTLKGTRTPSCVNAILYILEKAAGLRLEAPRGRFMLLPSGVRNLFAGGLVDRDGRRVETEIYRFKPLSLRGFFRRMRAIEAFFILLLPLHLAGLAVVGLCRRKMIIHWTGRRATDPDDSHLLLAVLRLAIRDLAHRLGRPLRIAWNLAHSTVHNAYGSYQVVKNMALLDHGAFEPTHPWATGIPPGGREPIWSDNIVFRSPPSREIARTDEDIVEKVGKFLLSMVRKSIGDSELPHGPKRRMSHAVNYIHGTIHFNSGYFLFDDFEDAVFHFTDPRFVAEIRRFTRREKREITIVFRDRDYDLSEAAYFIGFLRCIFPWFANANGPKRRVLYGTPAPFPVVNLINGTWHHDMKTLRHRQLDRLVRPPIEASRYFREEYQGSRRDYTFFEKLVAFYNFKIVNLRGFQGSLVFHVRKIIEPGKHQEYLAARRRGERPLVIGPVDSPFGKRAESGEDSPPLRS